MNISTDTQDTLERKGYENIEAYIEDLADEYTEGDTEAVSELISILGEAELFDGVVSSLEDYQYFI